NRQLGPRLRNPLGGVGFPSPSSSARSRLPNRSSIRRRPTKSPIDHSIRYTLPSLSSCRISSTGSFFPQPLYSRFAALKPRPCLSPMFLYACTTPAGTTSPNGAESPTTRPSLFPYVFDIARESQR